MFTGIISLSPHNNPMRYGLLFYPSPYYKPVVLCMRKLRQGEVGKLALDNIAGHWWVGFKARPL